MYLLIGRFGRVSIFVSVTEREEISVRSRTQQRGPKNESTSFWRASEKTGITGVSSELPVLVRACRGETTSAVWTWLQTAAKIWSAMKEVSGKGPVESPSISQIHHSYLNPDVYSDVSSYSFVGRHRSNPIPTIGSHNGLGEHRSNELRYSGVLTLLRTASRAEGSRTCPP